jgi:hypothetical protein
VERLTRRDEVHGSVVERRCLRRPGDAREAGVPSQPALGCLSHLPVGLDAEDAVAVLQEQLAQDACPGADVCDDGGAREGASRLEEIEYGTRVGGVMPDVVVYPVS